MTWLLSEFVFEQKVKQKRKHLDKNEIPCCSPPYRDTQLFSQQSMALTRISLRQHRGLLYHIVWLNFFKASNVYNFFFLPRILSEKYFYKVLTRLWTKVDTATYIFTIRTYSLSITLPSISIKRQHHHQSLILVDRSNLLEKLLPATMWNVSISTLKPNQIRKRRRNFSADENRNSMSFVLKFDKP